MARRWYPLFPGLCSGEFISPLFAVELVAELGRSVLRPYKL
jgi:hypothetical protein